MNLEEELRAALRREAAPEDFAARVLARTRPRAVVTRMPLWRRPVIVALAAVLVLVAALQPVVHEYRRQRRGVEAKDQLIAALSITRMQLQQAKEKVHQNTRHR